MPFRLPPAPKKYEKPNEDEARRLIEAAFANTLARLVAAEAAIAAGVTPPDPVGPTAGFTHSAEFLVVSFTDASTAGDAAITARLWTFGDGTTSTAPNNKSPIHTYPDAGTYQVTLRCTDADGLQDTTVATAVTVVKQTSAARPKLFLHGTDGIEDVQQFPTMFNAGQAAGMTPANCVAMIDAFANAGVPCFVRLWQPAASAPGGNFSMQGIKDSIKRYADAGLAGYLNARAQDGTIKHASIMDDVNSVGRWGREITPAEVEEIAAYHRSLYFAIPTSCRARPGQLGLFPFTALQHIQTSYLSSRGGISQGGMSNADYFVADCTAWRDQDIADLAALEAVTGYEIPMSFGLNVVNGGHPSSGMVGDNPTKFRMGAAELVAYGDLLIPFTDESYHYWQWPPDDDTVGQAYFSIPAIQASIEDNRALADSL